MSGIAGLLNRNGDAVDCAVLERMSAAMSYRGADGTDMWSDGPVALAHCHFWTTPEELGERQPVQYASGDCWITADARIDNRGDLIPLLRQAGTLASDLPTDAEVILAAYARWGDQCARHLIGDYAFAIWDGAARRLFLVRDALGMRNLFYAEIEGTFYFATTIGAILAAFDQPLELNRPLIRDYLTMVYTGFVCGTVYRDILRLPQAHQLTVRPEDSPIGQPVLYYILGSQDYDYTTDDEWIEAFRETLDEALRCRMRAVGPVGILVSGGLDSSALACIAHRMVEQKRVEAEVILYTAYFDQATQADEREYFAMVAERCHRFACRHMLADAFYAMQDTGADGDFPLDEPDSFPTRGYMRAMLSLAREDGTRVQIAGEGANQVLGHTIYGYPQTLAGIGLKDLIPEISHYRQYNHSYRKIAYRGMIRPLIGGPLERLMHSLRPPERHRAKLYPWLNLSASEIGDSPECTLDPGFKDAPGISQASVVSVLGRVRSPYDQFRYRSLDVLFAQEQSESRLPFLDRRVVDLLLRIPRRLQSWRGHDRIILREATEGILPEEIRVRTSKSHIGKLFTEGFRAERPRIEELMHGSRLEALRLIDDQSFLEAVKQCDRGSVAEIGRILNTVLAEIWLRHIDSRQ